MEKATEDQVDSGRERKFDVRKDHAALFARLAALLLLSALCFALAIPTKKLRESQLEDLEIARYRLLRELGCSVAEVRGHFGVSRLPTGCTLPCGTA